VADIKGYSFSQEGNVSRNTLMSKESIFKLCSANNVESKNLVIFQKKIIDMTPDKYRRISIDDAS